MEINTILTLHYTNNIRKPLVDRLSPLQKVNDAFHMSYSANIDNARPGNWRSKLSLNMLNNNNNNNNSKNIKTSPTLHVSLCLILSLLVLYFTVSHF